MIDNTPSFLSEARCTLDIAGTEQEKLIAMFKALGNPTRFEIMKFLIRQGFLEYQKFLLITGAI